MTHSPALTPSPRHFQFLGWLVLLPVFFFACSQTRKDTRILVFSKGEALDRNAVQAGVTSLQRLGQENQIRVDTTSNPFVFSQDSLQAYSAVVFMNTSGDVLDYRQQANFERYIQAGGGFVGINAASGSERGWPWYGQLIGASIADPDAAPVVRKETVEIINASHASTEGMPERWERADRWLQYTALHPDVNVVAAIHRPERAGGKAERQPVAWYHEFDGGRAFYTAGGSTAESYADPFFQKHLLGGIRYAIGRNNELDFRQATTLRVPEENRFTRVVLAEKLDEPLQLVVLPNSDVLFIERKGTLHLYKADQKKTRLVTRLDVALSSEDGLMGLALDPGFERNNWVYFYYSVAGAESKHRVARFVLKGDSLLKSTEKVLLEIPVQRGCCHMAGSLEFGPDGNLFISLGDNTNPFESDGYSPSDGRPGRQAFDAQRTSANTNDLRGKILRIKPQPDGSYTIPEGNLFPQDGSQGRPEIYVMGNRNPYRITVDAKTGYLYWGEVGPDAGEDSTGRGPRGYDEINQARQAGNYGWPYFVGDNLAYHAFDFETRTSGQPYNPKAPVNNSPNNTGIKNLPPAQPAFIWYPYAESKEFPAVGKGGRNAMAGQVYYADQYQPSGRNFPPYYDGKLFIYDWMRNWIMAVTLDQDGQYQKMEPVLPSKPADKPIDLRFGPDGALYVLEYGTYWRAQNDDSRLVRIEFNEGNRRPVAQMAADQTVGAAPLRVQFSGNKSYDFDPADSLTFAWKFDRKQVQSTEREPVFTFHTPGTYTVTLQVSDPTGEKATTTMEVMVGNEPPKVAVEMAGNTSFFWDNQTLPYTVRVSDREDGTVGSGIDPSAVTVRFDYLPQGKDLILNAMETSAAPATSVAGLKGKTLIAGSDCKACHAIDRNSVGPSYVNIANRYHQDKSAVNRLATKIIRGGGGNWGGEHEMSAHPQLTQADAAEMVRYILLLADEEPVAASLPLQGQVTTNKHTGAGVEGSYLLSATYTDQGGNGIKPFTSRYTVMLQHPRVAAVESAVQEGAAKGNYENYKIIKFNKNEAYLLFPDLDLTGVSRLSYRVGSRNASGILELRLGSPNGTLISKTAYVDKDTSPLTSDVRGFITWQDVSAPVIPSPGRHDLYLVYRSDKPVSVWSSFDLHWIHFHTSRPEHMVSR
jgi:cytochrome c